MYNNLLKSLHTHIKKAFGTNSQNQKEQEYEEKVPVARAALTNSVTESFTPKTLTSKSIANMWEKIASLIEDGLSRNSEPGDEEKEYISAIKNIASICRATSNFSQTIEIPQKYIDIITKDATIVYRAKAGFDNPPDFNTEQSNPPTKINTNNIIIDEDNDAFYFEDPTSDVSTKEKQSILALFAFKVTNKLKPYMTSSDQDQNQNEHYTL